MQSEAVASSTRRRKVPRAERRQQLIDATISCIAKRGFSGTTLADVARTAGLSQGIVNLHFNTKDTLLHETLQHLVDEYRQIWTKAIEDAGPYPVA